MTSNGDRVTPPELNFDIENADWRSVPWEEIPPHIALAFARRAAKELDDHVGEAKAAADRAAHLASLAAVKGQVAADAIDRWGRRISEDLRKIRIRLGDIESDLETTKKDASEARESAESAEDLAEEAAVAARHSRPIVVYPPPAPAAAAAPTAPALPAAAPAEPAKTPSSNPPSLAPILKSKPVRELLARNKRLAIIVIALTTWAWFGWQAWTFIRAL